MDRSILKNKAKSRDNTLAVTDQDLVADVDEVVRLLAQYVKQQSVSLASSWVLSMDRWVRMRTQNSVSRYVVGQVVFVDLGPGCFQPETDSQHACVVLCVEPNWMLVAPITSQKQPDNVTLIAIQSNDVYGVVMVKQIRSISKSRVVGPWKGRSGEKVVLDVKPFWEAIQRLVPEVESSESEEPIV